MCCAHAEQRFDCHTAMPAGGSACGMQIGAHDVCMTPARTRGGLLCGIGVQVFTVVAGGRSVVSARYRPASVVPSRCALSAGGLKRGLARARPSLIWWPSPVGGC
jgi:hypothetical protein